MDKHLSLMTRMESMYFKAKSSGTVRRISTAVNITCAAAMASLGCLSGASSSSFSPQSVPTQILRLMQFRQLSAELRLCLSALLSADLALADLRRTRLIPTCLTAAKANEPESCPLACKKKRDQQPAGPLFFTLFFNFPFLSLSLPPPFSLLPASLS